MAKVYTLVLNYKCIKTGNPAFNALLVLDLKYRADFSFLFQFEASEAAASLNIKKDNQDII